MHSQPLRELEVNFSDPHPTHLLTRSSCPGLLRLPEISRFDSDTKSLAILPAMNDVAAWGWRREEGQGVSEHDSLWVTCH